MKARKFIFPSPPDPKRIPGIYVDEPQNTEYINCVEGKSDIRPFIQ